MGCTKSVPSDQSGKPSTDTKEVPVTRIAVIGPPGAGKFEFANRIAKSYGQPLPEKGVVDKPVVVFETSVDGKQEKLEITIIGQNKLLDRVMNGRYARTDIMLLMFPINSTSEVFDYWKFFIDVVRNKCDGTVFLVGSKADLRETNEKANCIEKEIGFKKVLEKSIATRNDLYSYLNDDNLFCFECCKTGEGDERILQEAVKIRRSRQ